MTTRSTKTGRRMAIAIVLSLLAHLVALFGHRINLMPGPDVVRLDVVMKRAAPDKTPGQTPKPEKPPQKEVPAPRPEPTPETAKAEAKDPPIETPPPPQPEPKVESVEPPQPEVPTPPPEPTKAAGSTWPRTGVIKYQLFGGEARDPNLTSNAELRWEIATDGRYTMKLESHDAKPFPSMPWFTISFAYTSVGKLVEGVFLPDRYEEAISVFQNIAVNFDRVNNVVDFAGHRLPLPPGTQDYLSVIMQAGDPGFVERGMMAVATGRGLRQYRFESLGEGDLALPFGMTWKARQLWGKTGNNDVRVWVATERFNLPVQIRFVVNRVNYYLIATEVLVSRDALTASSNAPTNVPAVPAAAPLFTAPASPVTATVPPVEQNNALDKTPR